MSNLNFGHYLKNLRQARGLSAYRLSQLSGVDRGLLAKIETDQRRATDDVLTKLASVVGVSFEELKAWADLSELGNEGVDRLFRFASSALMERCPTDATQVQATVRHFPFGGEGAKFAPTRDELALIRLAEEHGVIFGPFREPGFWNKTSGDRRSAFLFLEGLVAEAIRFQSSTLHG